MVLRSICLRRFYRRLPASRSAITVFELGGRSEFPAILPLTDPTALPRSLVNDEYLAFALREVRIR